jgi:uncharacterized membrane protein (GlpM family)
MFWIGLVVKMAMTAAVVVGTSVVVERSGSFLGALIASLPTAAGAAYIILAVKHPPNFIAASAVGSIASAATVSVFCATYTLLAQRRGLTLSSDLRSWRGSRPRRRCASPPGRRFPQSGSTLRCSASPSR